MKKLYLLLIALILTIFNLFAARMLPATGRVVDTQGQAVEYATVVLLRDGEQVAGMATDAEGRFSVKVPAGAYTLSIQYLGYEPFRQQICVEQERDLGDFTLRTSTTEIEGVEIKAQLIRREADRFVVDVANSAAAIGRDGIELLEAAPGIWIDGERISINGKTGSKVYVDDRELRMEPTQLLSYLRSLRAEEIRKIEVIPTVGADYDADSAGGAIRITLRKRRENGLTGDLSFNTEQGGRIGSYSPDGRIDAHTGRLDLFLSGWGYFARTNMRSDERNDYDTQHTALTARSDARDRNRSGGGCIGGVFQIDERNSIGAELQYLHQHERGTTDSRTDFAIPDAATHTDSRYLSRSRCNNYTTLFNYIHRIDTLGSTLKLLLDYTHRSTDNGNDNLSRIDASAAPQPVDSLYRDIAASRYDIATATLALEKRLSSRWTLKAGAKYTRNDMRNEALYEYLKDESWIRNDRQSFTVNYTENIAALYGIASAQLGRLSVVAGLRGEYTRTRGKGHGIGQDYFSLFPNVNASWSLTADQAYSLVAQYARTISRPGFWTLNPRRTQISDYTYQTGNPDLDPAYKHDVSLTLVMAHKYTLTGGVTVQTDEIQQYLRADADDPNRLCIAWTNFDRTTGYYASANLPFQPAKWWQLNVNATYLRHGQRIEPQSPTRYQNVVLASASSTFTLPAGCYVDLSYRYQGRMELGNCWVEPLHFVDAGVKKRFGERFTLTLKVRNLFAQPQQVGAKGDGFVRLVKVKQPWNSRTFRVGISYNFKSGKAFNRKSVETGAGDEKSRM